MITESSKNTPDLTCQELVELVTDYVEGKLPPRIRSDSRRTWPAAGIAGPISIRCVRPSGYSAG